jgi:hypothetical protein
MERTAIGGAGACVEFYAVRNSAGAIGACHHGFTMSTPTPSRAVTLTRDDPGAAAARFLVCWQKSNGNLHEAAELAAQSSRTMPIVEHTFRQMITKGAVGAQALSATDPYSIGAIFFSLLQSASVLGRLSPFFRRVPFRIKVPADTAAGGTFSWRAEGTAAPVTKSVTATITQEVSAADYLVIITNELFRFGRVAEQMLREMVIAGLARGIDGQLLDRTVAPTASHPGSLFYGTPTITSAGTTAANVITDLTALISTITSPGDNLFFVMRPTTYANVSAKLAGVGYPVERGYLLGIPVLASSTSPRQIGLVDASNFAYSSDDTMTIDVTTDAAVEMDTAPTQSGITGTGSAMVSLFQAGMTGIKAELFVAWQPIHFNGGSPTVPSGAAVVTVTY